MEIKDSKFYRDKCYINGEWVNADSGETISVNNPANLSLSAEHLKLEML